MSKKLDLLVQEFISYLSKKGEEVSCDEALDFLKDPEISERFKDILKRQEAESVLQAQKEEVARRADRKKKILSLMDGDLPQVAPDMVTSTPVKAVEVVEKKRRIPKEVEALKNLYGRILPPEVFETSESAMAFRWMVLRQVGNVNRLREQAESSKDRFWEEDLKIFLWELSEKTRHPLEQLVFNAWGMKKTDYASRDTLRIFEDNFIFGRHKDYRWLWDVPQPTEAHHPKLPVSVTKEETAEDLRKKALGKEVVRLLVVAGMDTGDARSKARHLLANKKYFAFNDAAELLFEAAINQADASGVEAELTVAYLKASGQTSDDLQIVLQKIADARKKKAETAKAAAAARGGACRKPNPGKQKKPEGGKGRKRG